MNTQTKSIDNETFLNNYWEIYKGILSSKGLNQKLISIKKQILETNKNKGKLFFFWQRGECLIIKPRCSGLFQTS